MSPENLRKLAHPELEISTVNIISVRKWGNEQTDRQKKSAITFNKCRNIPGMSPENLKTIAHLEQEISKDNLISVRKWGNEQTDRGQT